MPPKATKTIKEKRKNDDDPLRLENDVEELAMAKELALRAKRKLGFVEGSSSNNGGLAINVEEELEKETGSRWRIIKVKVKRDDEDDMWFKIERDVPLRWLIIRYCDQAGLDFRATRFDFKGVRLREMDTPQQLGMLDEDVIYAFSSTTEGGHGHSVSHYATLCVRMHKGKDTFLRVRRTVPILHELKRCFLCEGVSKELDSVCFVYNGMKLTQDHTAVNLNMEDGDVIDGFDFIESSSSLAIIRSHISIEIKTQTGKKSVYRMNPATTPMIKMMKVYCKVESMDYDHLRFIHCGRVLDPSKTAEQNRVEDGDTIHVVIRMSGC